VVRGVVESHVLSPSDATNVSAVLPFDANDYFYSATMSIVDALRAVDAGFFTWSTVKMYYSVFYSLRAILAWDDVAVFRPSEKAPFRVKASAGASPVFVDGKGSHQSMLNCFRRVYPGHSLISQTIDVDDPFDWLLGKREDANYHIARFSEPDIPDHYEQIIRIGIRKAISAYLDPSNSILIFDKDHAIVSYPLAIWRIAGQSAISRGGAMIGGAESAFLSRKCQERKAVLAPIMNHLRSTLRR
jgi:hypothetical protein